MQTLKYFRAMAEVIPDSLPSSSLFYTYSILYDRSILSEYFFPIIIPVIWPEKKHQVHNISAFLINKV
jgi:hypothetical protein